MNKIIPVYFYKKQQCIIRINQPKDINGGARMTQINGIDEWVEVTEYFRYIEDMIERNFKQNYGVSLREFYVLHELYKRKIKSIKLMI